MSRDSEVGPDLPRRPDSQIQTAATKPAIHREPTAPVGQSTENRFTSRRARRRIAAHELSSACGRREQQPVAWFLDGPSSFGLTGRELWVEGRRLLDEKSWQQWEVWAVMANPREVPERGWVR